MLCKHEVVGSIPSGSTTLRLRLRVAEPSEAKDEACPAKLDRAKTGRVTIDQDNSSAKTSLRMRAPGRDAACGISDIVKRRSIRVGSCKQLRGPSLSPDHFGARASQDGRVVNDPFSEA